MSCQLFVSVSLYNKYAVIEICNHRRLSSVYIFRKIYAGGAPIELSPTEFFVALMENMIGGMQPGITGEGFCRMILIGIVMYLAQGRINRLVLYAFEAYGRNLIPSEEVPAETSAA